MLRSAGVTPLCGSTVKESADRGAARSGVGMQSQDPRERGVVVAGLREQLIGAWKLVSYTEHPTDGSEPFHPLGESPQGIIMYTPDGYMSAQLSLPDRSQFASGDWFDATDAEYKAEATSYIAYTGPFEVDEEKGELFHTMFVSLFPNWTGQTQQRVVSLEGDTLKLGSAAPIMSSGKEVESRLEWRRAESR
jgi:hypothetical protein